MIIQWFDYYRSLKLKICGDSLAIYDTTYVKIILLYSNRVLKSPGGGMSTDSVFSDSSASSTCSMASSPNESRASSTSPKTPAKKYHMKSNFELGDEQPLHPISPTRRPYKPSGI